jgi:hypothetical protein
LVLPAEADFGYFADSPSGKPLPRAGAGSTRSVVKSLILWRAGQNKTANTYVIEIALWLAAATLKTAEITGYGAWPRPPGRRRR